jgi:uncharacterized membrane protein YdbT with pleckstrin-like domain
MGYVDSNLLPGETIIKRAVIHWFIFVPSSFLLVMGLLLLQYNTLIGIVLLGFGVVRFVSAFLMYISTELVITSQRVMAKFGFIRRVSIELSHNKVGSMFIEQSVMGRILDFGTVIISGFGGANTPIPNIQNPLGFRRIALSFIEGNPLQPSEYPPSEKRSSE